MGRLDRLHLLLHGNDTLVLGLAGLTLLLQQGLVIGIVHNRLFLVLLRHGFTRNGYLLGIALTAGIRTVVFRMLFLLRRLRGIFSGLALLMDMESVLGLVNDCRGFLPDIGCVELLCRILLLTFLAEEVLHDHR